MAPTAARRARLVQRSHFQDLQGNPDACRPRRGSACSVSANRAGGNADPVFASPVQPTAAMSPRTGGSRVGEAPRPFFPPISSGRNGGARRAGAPPGGPDNSGRSQVTPTSSAQAADHSLPRKRESSFPPLGLLLPTPTTSLGRRGGPIGRAESYPRAPSLAPLGQFTLSRPTGPVVAGANGRMISAPTEWAVTRRLRGAPRPFGGMAPTAARRARPVQRSGCQGLPGDRRGPPKARQRLSRNQKRNRAWMHARFLLCLYSFPPP